MKVTLWLGKFKSARGLRFGLVGRGLCSLLIAHLSAAPALAATDAAPIPLAQVLMQTRPTGLSLWRLVAPEMTLEEVRWFENFFREHRVDLSVPVTVNPDGSFSVKGVRYEIDYQTGAVTVLGHILRPQPGRGWDKTLQDFIGEVRAKSKTSALSLVLPAAHAEDNTSYLGFAALFALVAVMFKGTSLAAALLSGFGALIFLAIYLVLQFGSSGSDPSQGGPDLTRTTCDRDGLRVDLGRGRSLLMREERGRMVFEFLRGDSFERELSEGESRPFWSMARQGLEECRRRGFDQPEFHRVMHQLNTQVQPLLRRRHETAAPMMHPGRAAPQRTRL